MVGLLLGMVLPASGGLMSRMISPRASSNRLTRSSLGRVVNRWNVKSTDFREGQIRLSVYLKYPDRSIPLNWMLEPTGLVVLMITVQFMGNLQHNSHRTLSNSTQAGD